MAFLPLDQLRSGAAELGIELSEDQVRALDEFAELLVETNKHFNLTRITEPSAIVTDHYLDSLSCLAAVEVEPGSRVIDVGTGGGFPGVPIAVVRPDLRITCLDATRKKLDFIAEAVRKLGIDNVSVLHGRAEEIGRELGHRERYDIAFARALSEMRVLAELCLPLVRVGGCVIAQKSTNVDAELDAARPIIGQLGGGIAESRQVRISDADIERRIIVIAKIRPTPDQFPRSYGRIVRSKA